jgi:hypothetical protein
VAPLIASAGSGDGAQVRAARGTNWAGFAVIVAASALATAPMVVRGTSCGNDFDFHLVSWIDALQSWRHGIVYPHWAASANFNTGEPRFVFYPPLEWMLGAALGAVMPWAAVPVALVFLLFAGTGLATRALAREAMENGPATLAGCLAIFSGYALLTAYQRSAYAELAGGLCIPLMLMFLLRDGRPASASMIPRSQNRDGGYPRAMDSVPALAFTIAAAWLSNVPVGLMASYLLGAVALACAVTVRSWRPLARAAAGLGLGLGLAGIYLVPAIAEQHWVDVSQALLDPYEQIQNSFLFSHQVISDPDTALHNIELDRISWMAVGMTAAALAGVLVSWRRSRLPGARRWWIPLALIPPAVLLLLLPVSLPVWNLLPRMRWLQFCWRWLTAVEAPMGIFVAAAVWSEGRRWMVAAACGVGCLGMTMVAGQTFFTPCYPEDSVPGMLAAYRAGTGFEGADEYSPEDADSSLIAIGLPGGCLVRDTQTKLGVGIGDEQPQWSPAQGSCLQAFSFDGGGDADHWKLRGTAAQDGWLVLRLRAYPAWRVRVNGQAEAQLSRREDGLIVVPAHSGSFQVTVDWTTLREAWAGRGISLAALVLVIGLWVRERRQSGAQLS